MTSSAPAGRTPWPILLGVVSATVLGIFAVKAWRQSKRAENERTAIAVLKSLTTAEATFRREDIDGNEVQDFWTGDLKGLHDLIPVKGGDPIRLIPKEIAEADPTHPNAQPHFGYWFVPLDTDEEGNEYRQGKSRNRNPTKFGFCAYPAEFGVTGGFHFYVNEGNTIFKKPDRERRTSWPTDQELRNIWSTSPE